MGMREEIERMKRENAALRAVLKPVLEHDCKEYGRFKNWPEAVKVIRGAQLMALSKGVA